MHSLGMSSAIIHEFCNVLFVDFIRQRISEATKVSKFEDFVSERLVHGLSFGSSGMVPWEFTTSREAHSMSRHASLSGKEQEESQQFKAYGGSSMHQAKEASGQSIKMV